MQGLRAGLLSYVCQWLWLNGLHNCKHQTIPQKSPILRRRAQVWMMDDGDILHSAKTFYEQTTDETNEEDGEAGDNSQAGALIKSVLVLTIIQHCHMVWLRFCSLHNSTVVWLRQPDQLRYPSRGGFNGNISLRHIRSGHETTLGKLVTTPLGSIA